MEGWTGTSLGEGGCWNRGEEGETGGLEGGGEEGSWGG